MFKEKLKIYSQFPKSISIVSKKIKAISTQTAIDTFDNFESVVVEKVANRDNSGYFVDVKVGGISISDQTEGKISL